MRKSAAWIWVFLVLIVLLLSGTVVVFILASQRASAALPDEVDVVLHVRPDNPTRAARHIYQARAVRKHMPWVRQVFVLSPNEPEVRATEFYTYVPFSGTGDEAYNFMPDIAGIANHAMFLADQTLPWRYVSKSFLFIQGQPRLFNYFRDTAEASFFQDYLETTWPALVADLPKLKEEPRTWQNLVFREVTEEQLVLRNDMNRDVFVVSSMATNSQLQFDALQAHAPLFATFQDRKSVV